MKKNLNEKLTYYSRKYLVAPLGIRWSGVLSQPKSTDGITHSLSAFRRELVFCIAGEYSSHTHTHTHTLSLSLSLSLSSFADTQQDSTPITDFRDLFRIRLYQGWRTYGTLTQKSLEETSLACGIHCWRIFYSFCLTSVSIRWRLSDCLQRV